MKILYLCADPGIPILGRKGCSTHVRETILALTEMGHEVRVVCANTEGDPATGAGLNLAVVAAPRSRKLGFDLRHVVLDRRFGQRVEAVIEEWRPDAIYERYSLYSRAGTQAARRRDLPRLLEVNAFLTREQQGRIRLPWAARMVERGILRKAPRVIVVSEPLRQEIHKLGVPLESIIKMPMAVNLDNFNPSCDGSAVRQRHGFDGRFVLGYVGTLAGWHGIRLLYDLAKELQRRDAPPFAFLVVGGDPHKVEQHRQRAGEAGLGEVMHFIGSVPHESVPEHIAAFDAALVPDTTYWSSPAKLFEYQASGVPVLAPDYPAIREAMTDNGEGFIFPPLDVARMAEAVLNMMHQPDLRRRMGTAARARAEREHSWRHNAEAIIGLYHQLGARD